MSRRPFDGAAARQALRRKAHDLLAVAHAAPPLLAHGVRAEAGELMTLAARLDAIGDDPGPTLLAEIRRHVEAPTC